MHYTIIALGGRTLKGSPPDVRLGCQHSTRQEKLIQGTSQDVQARIREEQGRGVYYVFSAATRDLLFDACAGDDWVKLQPQEKDREKKGR